MRLTSKQHCVEVDKLGFPTHIVEGEGKISISLVRNLRIHIEEHQIDILHTHGYKTDLIGLLATRGTHRLHSALEYVRPNNYEKQLTEMKKAAYLDCHKKPGQINHYRA